MALHTLVPFEVLRYIERNSNGKAPHSPSSFREYLQVGYRNDKMFSMSTNTMELHTSYPLLFLRFHCVCCCFLVVLCVGLEWVL